MPDLSLALSLAHLNLTHEHTHTHTPHHRDVGEKSDAFHGLFAMLQLNARSVAPHFVRLCEAIKSWTRPSAELVAMFKRIVAAFKQAFGTNWPQMEATFQKPLKDFMTMHYGM